MIGLGLRNWEGASLTISPLSEKNGNIWVSALTGIAIGGFLVSLATQLYLLRGWYIGNYELLAALAAALGVWAFAGARNFTNGLLGAAAALAAMLLGDSFRAMAFNQFLEWSAIPNMLKSQFEAEAWPKVIRYAFGVYIGGYLGYYGRIIKNEESA